MPRDRGLRQLYELSEIAHAKLTRLNQGKDPETDRVREGPEHQVHRGLGRGQRIRLGELDRGVMTLP